FDSSSIIYDVCKSIYEKFSDYNLGPEADYGLFLADEDPKKGIWLDPGHALDFYMLKNGDLVEYRRRMRPLKVKMLDGTVKTVMADDSHHVGQLIKSICLKLGIQNSDEFSLVVEEVNDEISNKTQTKDKTIQRDQKKLDQLIKKLHTDDELNWLAHEKTLREQGVDESQTLVLRRRFFFADSNVSTLDPVQLNLLYVQTRDDIIKGTHPVTFEEACTFGGLQCQIQIGNHDPSKHKPGYVDLKQYLPAEYVKMRGAERKILSEHAELGGLSELEAKEQYVKQCRALKTYGVTFFVVKEKIKGKNKLAPRLLGITRDSVLRVDEKTKEVLKSWPLTTIRRWAASANSFTLDFGDYSDSFYSVQTKEGEQISQLIAGYIDIIIKKRRVEGRQLDFDEEGAVMEDSVSPASATVIQQRQGNSAHSESQSVSVPGIVGQGGQAPQSLIMGSVQQNAHISSKEKHAHQLHAPQSPKAAFLSNISAGFMAASATTAALDEPAELPDLGSDPASLQWKRNTLHISQENVRANIAAINGSAAAIILLTSNPDKEIDYTAIGSSVTTISSNMNDMAKRIKMIAALQDDEYSVDLITATKELASAFVKLLKSSQPESMESRQSLLEAANDAGIHSKRILTYMGDKTLNEQFHEDLLNAAKAVALATTTLMKQAKNVASNSNDPSLQDTVIITAKNGAISSSQLVTCVKILSPTLDSLLCQEQLFDAGQNVIKAINNVVAACKNESVDEDLQEDVDEAANQVKIAIDNLNNFVKGNLSSSNEISKYDGICDVILDASEKLFNSVGNAVEMIKQAKMMAQGASDLVNSIKLEATEEQYEGDRQKSLLSAARMVSDATGQMVAAAKACTQRPNDPVLQQELKRTAENLRYSVNAASGNALIRKRIFDLEIAAKQLAISTMQLIAAAHGVSTSNRNENSQKDLEAKCKSTGDSCAKLIEGYNNSAANPNKTGYLLALISASEEMIQPASDLITSARSANPHVNNMAAANQLSAFTKATVTALNDLKTACNKASEVCGSVEMDTTLEVVDSLIEDLAAIRVAVDAKKLLPLPGESLEACTMELGATCKSLGSAMAQLITAATQGNESYTGLAGRDMTNLLRALTGSVRGVAAGSDDVIEQAKIINNADEVLRKSNTLLSNAKLLALNPGDPNLKTLLHEAAKDMASALTKCIDCLPGQNDVNTAIDSIRDSSNSLKANVRPILSLSRDRSLQDCQNKLSTMAASLNVLANEVVKVSTNSSQELPDSAKKFAAMHSRLLSTGSDVAGHFDDNLEQDKIVGNLRNISKSSINLLSTAKLHSMNPSAPNIRNELTAAVRAVAEGINKLIDSCTKVSSLGAKECERGLRRIQVMAGVIDSPKEPVTDASYFACLETVVEKSKLLGETMSSVNNHAKKSEEPEFINAVKMSVDLMCILLEAAAQAAYLVAISDPSSIAGKPGLIDQAYFARLKQAIIQATDTVAKTDSTSEELLVAATEIAKNSTLLCTACKEVSVKTSNPVAKRQFVLSAKDVANGTGNVVRSIRNLAAAYSNDAKETCIAATRPLVEAVESLILYASSPEFASVPAKINTKAQEAQVPIVTAGKVIVSTGSTLFSAARDLMFDGEDNTQPSKLSGHIKGVLSAIKQLVAAIKEKAPGQQEISLALDQINRCITAINQNALLAISGMLSPQEDATLQALQDRMTGLVNEMLYSVDGLATAAKGEPEKLGHQVTSFTNFIEPLTNAAIGAASVMNNQSQQRNLLDQTKTVTEALYSLMSAAKEAGGNVKASNIVEAKPEHSFVDYQTRIARTAKAIATCSQDMVSTRIKTSVYEVGKSSLALTKLCGLVESDPDDQSLKRKLADSARSLAENVSYLMAAMQSGSRGTQACIDGCTILSGLIGDLSTYSMFASAGTLESEVENDSFVNYRDEILLAAKSLAEDCSKLTASSSFTQEQLADDIHKIIDRISCLSNSIKLGASALPVAELDTQVMLLNSAMDVAVALNNLLNATKSASGKPDSDPSFAELKTNAKSLVESVSSLIKTVTTVGTSSARGLRALESTINAISHELKSIDKPPENSERKVTPEDLIRSTKGITVATARAVACGNSGKQEDILAAANAGRQAVFNMIEMVKLAALECNLDVKTDLISSCQDCVNYFLKLLQSLSQTLENPTTERKQSLPLQSRYVASAVSELVRIARELKGNDYVDPEDPATMAENELLNAAASIEMAAKKLEKLKPRQMKNSADESLNFEEQIIEAAKSITSATALLIKCATVAQRELVEQGKIKDIKGGESTQEESQWSEGLISAARMVATAVGALCDAANAAVQGNASVERLVSSAKAVAASTAQLLVACQVKADKESKSNARLQKCLALTLILIQAAGNAVKKATDSLVKAAKVARGDRNSDPIGQPVIVNKKLVGSLAQEIEAQEAILKKERELEEAKKRLAAIRKAKYHHDSQNKPGKGSETPETSGSSSSGLDAFGSQ
ncbi:uncharacterized protein TRIADDRAFT_19795, partial [Trichoplax adhaerens]